MNKHLEQLVKLSQFDKDIVNFEPQIQNEQEKLKVFTQVVDKLTKQENELISFIEDSQSKSDKNNTHLTELTEKLGQIAGKHKVAKNEKEVKALQLEEEIAKEQVNFANEEIVRLDALVESKTTELTTIQEQLTEENKTVQELKTVVDASIGALEKSRDTLSESKSNLISSVDAKVLTYYEKIKRWAKEKAVVEVKNQACYGCHMKLNDRFYSEFILSDDIMTCPHCGRIIYKSEEQ